MAYSRRVPQQKAHGFDYQGAQPPIVRFASRQCKSDLLSWMGKLALIEIKEEKGKVIVCVSPQQCTRDWLHQEFQRRCQDSLNTFFQRFDAWRGKFDRAILKAQHQDTPEFFEEKSSPYYHVKWFLDTGFVNVTGFSEHVKQWRQSIEDKFNDSPPPHFKPKGLVYPPTARSTYFPDPVSVCSPCVPYSSPLASEKMPYNYRPSVGSLSPESKTIHFNAEDISPAVLRFVSKSFALKKELQECCGTIAKVIIKNDLGHLEVSISFKKNYSEEDKDKVFIAVKTYFEKFASQNKTYDKEKLKKLVERYPDLFTQKSGVYIKPFTETGTVIIVGFTEEVLVKEREIDYEIYERTEEDESSDVEEVQVFYPMTEKTARHIQNPNSQCKIFKAKSVEMKTKNGQDGLLVTCENEDINTVSRSVQELKIVHTEVKITGYSLYEHLVKEEKHLRVERDTNCSVFLEGLKKPAQKDSHVSVIAGNILDENCDAIVNSIDKSKNLTGQLSQALEEKYGASVLSRAFQHFERIIKDQVYLCRCSNKLRWNVLHVVTPPRENQLKKFFLDLLVAADGVGITSIALPTIGTGNMGLDPVLVAKAMKDAFLEFCYGEVVHLKDIRLVVYDKSLLSVFKDVALEDGAGEKSTELVATIYGNDKSSLLKAVEYLKEIRDNNIKCLPVSNPSLTVIPEYVKSRTREICLKNGVSFEWKKNGIQEQCLLQGVVDNVKRAGDEIDKLLKAGYPPTWSRMLDDHEGSFVIEKLDETSEEYKKVKANFTKSSPNYTKILKIERIQNPFLYKQFKIRKDSKQNCTRPVTRQLFHGTTVDSAEKICAHGFNRSYAGKNGTMLGHGVYFHVDSCYSVNYAPRNDSAGCVFFAEVVTGDYTKGKPGSVDLPQKGNSTLLYDSLVDDCTNPKIFVVLRDNSVYPSYLITFK